MGQEAAMSSTYQFGFGWGHTTSDEVERVNWALHALNERRPDDPIYFVAVGSSYWFACQFADAATMEEVARAVGAIRTDRGPRPIELAGAMVPYQPA
jgi:hypothetical protein